MSQTQLTFELVVPEKLLVSQSVAMVTIPGGEGDYGVLSGHAPMITTVKPGVVSVYADSETTVSKRIFVGGGFAEVTGERCTILAEEASDIAELNRDQVQQELKSLNDALAAAASDSERAKVAAHLAVTQAKLDALAA